MGEISLLDSVSIATKESLCLFERAEKNKRFNKNQIFKEEITIFKEVEEYYRCCTRSECWNDISRHFKTFENSVSRRLRASEVDDDELHELKTLSNLIKQIKEIINNRVNQNQIPVRPSEQVIKQWFSRKE